MATLAKITPCLWFDSEGEEAAKFYTDIFPNSKIAEISRYGEEGKEFHGKEPGTALTMAFELDGQKFTALNGGPKFKFTEATSFQINCETQAEVDHYWEKLGEGGEPRAQQCGWVKDKFGLSWQMVPTVLPKLLSVTEKAKAGRVMQAMLQMKKLDIATLEAAAKG